MTGGHYPTSSGYNWKGWQQPKSHRAIFFDHDVKHCKTKQDASF
jgi:hypothetical protein